MNIAEAVHALKQGAVAAIRLSAPRKELRYDDGVVYEATAYPNNCSIIEKNHGPSWEDVWADDWQVLYGD